MAVNIWKSYIWAADKDVNMKAIFKVMNSTQAEVKISPKNFIHHFMGLFGTNIRTSSQLAC